MVMNSILVSQTVSAPLVQSEMGGFLSDAAPMADEVGYQYEGTSICTIGGPAASVTSSP